MIRMTNGTGARLTRRLSLRPRRLFATGLVFLGIVLPATACINTEAETLYEDVEITRKDALPADAAEDDEAADEGS